MATRAPKLQTVEGALNEPLTVNHPNLAAAMTAAFAEIEGATKAATNPHFKSKYADLTSIIEAIKPALIKHGLFFTQRCQPSEDGVSVETVLHHSSGEKEPLGILYVPANKRDAQGFGSALTYARRYALQTAFGVPTEDDDGNAAVASAPRAKPVAMITDEQRSLMAALIPAAGKTVQDIVEAYGVSSIAELSEAKAAAAIARLKSLAKEPA
jgi:hypothetical protein